MATDDGFERTYPEIDDWTDSRELLARARQQTPGESPRDALGEPRRSMPTGLDARALQPFAHHVELFDDRESARLG